MDLLHGAIDTHVHSFPDVIARKLDDLALVQQARAAGLRAVVLKSHVFSTAERAWLLNRLYPEVRTLGSITLNDTVGGLNPHAVEAALALGAAVVWMPTLSAANHARHLGGRGTLSVVGGGRLCDEALAILRLIAARGAVLATGHLAPEESELLIEAALEQGVSRISVTHPEWPVTAMPLSVQQRLTKTGLVYLERCFVATQSGAPGPISFATIVEQIRATPLAQNVIASDFGMPQYATPVEGLRAFIAALATSGFTDDEIRALCQANPARLLKLEAA